MPKLPLIPDMHFNGVQNENWRQWRPSCFLRRDHATVAMPHDDAGKAVAPYWLGWPPFIDAGVVREVVRRRFATPGAAMAFVDKAWPIEEACTPYVKSSAD